MFANKTSLYRQIQFFWNFQNAVLFELKIFKTL